MFKKISVFEFVWYILCALSALTGLTFIILGLFGQYGNDAAKLRVFSTPGYICLIAGAIAASIVLMIFAKTSDRAVEAAARRAARLGKVEETPKSE